MRKFKASDYGDRTLKNAVEKRWDILQVLYAIYIAGNEPQSFEVSLPSLLVKNRSESLIRSILKSLESEGCFRFEILNGIVHVVNIDNTKIDEIYKRTGKEYKKFAVEYQRTHPNQSENLDYSKSVPFYDKEKHQIEFLGKYIPIKRDSHQEELCILLLTNKTVMKQKRHMDQLLEKLGAEDDGKKQISIYRAAIGINDNIAKITGVKDLIITGYKELRINPKYLKNQG